MVACQVCDEVVGTIWEACKECGVVLVVTSDHGNAEEMVDAMGQPKTSHTLNMVPLIVASDREEFEVIHSEGGLIDVAPTVLSLMGLEIPSEMTGRPMVRSKSSVGK